MALPLWALLAASLAFGAAEDAPCPYHYRYEAGETGYQLIAPRPLGEKDCAFVKSLEEPLRRMARAGSLKPEAGRVSEDLILNHGRLNAFYDPDKGILLADGFLSCVGGDRDAALQMLCHEMGHAVQYGGADPRAREAIELMRSGGVMASSAAGAAKLRDLERQADAIGRELCTRAGLSMNLTAQSDAFDRCAGPQRDDILADHPATPERRAAARADAPRLSEERAREVGAAIQRRARRLMAGLPTADDLAADTSVSPRAWAVTPAADQDRLRGAYSPSRKYDEFQDHLREPPPPKDESRAGGPTRIVVRPKPKTWLDSLRDLWGGS